MPLHDAAARSSQEIVEDARQGPAQAAVPMATRVVPIKVSNLFFFIEQISEPIRLVAIARPQDFTVLPKSRSVVSPSGEKRETVLA